MENQTRAVTRLVKVYGHVRVRKRPTVELNGSKLRLFRAVSAARTRLLLHCVASCMHAHADAEVRAARCAQLSQPPRLGPAPSMARPPDGDADPDPDQVGAVPASPTAFTNRTGAPDVGDMQTPGAAPCSVSRATVARGPRAAPALRSALVLACLWPTLTRQRSCRKFIDMGSRSPGKAASFLPPHIAAADSQTLPRRGRSWEPCMGRVSSSSASLRRQISLTHCVFRKTSAVCHRRSYHRGGCSSVAGRKRNSGSCSGQRSGLACASHGRR